MIYLKYFILKPKSKTYNDQYAKASRCAMLEYANKIESQDPSLAKELVEWSRRESKHDVDLMKKPISELKPKKGLNNKGMVFFFADLTYCEMGAKIKRGWICTTNIYFFRKNHRR